jgi:hypothetical protein
MRRPSWLTDDVINEIDIWLGALFWFACLWLLWSFVLPAFLGA